MQDAPYRLIPLRRRDGTVRAHAIVDAADYEWLVQRRWSLHSAGYAQHGTTMSGKRLVILMHRAILGLEAGDQREGDHINGNRLDNRRENLRIVPRIGNAQNRTVSRGSSGFVGVVYRPEYGTWTARVKVDSAHHVLGTFATELDAGAAAAQFRHARMPYAIEDPGLLAHVIRPNARHARTPDTDRASEVVRRWHAGESLRVIAAFEGLSVGGLGALMTRLRKLGYDLPYRRAGWA